MADRSLHWVECDTPGCSSTTREQAQPDDFDLANQEATRLGWSHYTEGHNGFDLVDVCPECLANRPDLAAMCFAERYESP